MVFFCGAAQLRLCADGGANRVYDEMPSLLADEDKHDVRNRYCDFVFQFSPARNLIKVKGLKRGSMW